MKNNKLEHCDDYYQDIHPDNAFYSILQQGHHLFFDTEMVAVGKLVNQLYKLFRHVDRRFQRGVTYRVSESKVECMSYQFTDQTTPWLRYRFVNGDTTLSIVPYAGEYYLYLEHPTSVSYDMYLAQHKLVKRPFNEHFIGPGYNSNGFTLDEAKKAYLELVVHISGGYFGLF